MLAVYTATQFTQLRTSGKERGLSQSNKPNRFKLVPGSLSLSLPRYKGHEEGKAWRLGGHDKSHGDVKNWWFFKKKKQGLVNLNFCDCSTCPLTVLIVRWINSNSNFRLANEKNKTRCWQQKTLILGVIWWGTLMNMITKLQNPKNGFLANANLKILV